MFELIAANWLVFLIALLIGIATAYWVWARYRMDADVQTPAIAPSAPKTVADLAREMPAATEPVVLMSTVKAAPKAKVAAAPKVKSAPKPKADPVPKAKTTPAPVKAAALPKAKAEAPKVKAVAVAKTVAPKAKAAPAVKPKADPVPKAAPAAKPKAVAKPKAASKPASKIVIPDNLELLKGVGPKLNALLKSLGVTSFEQVANWSAADVRETDALLGTFAGRISRDNWVDQAKLLAAGDVTGFEKKYGSLGSEIQKG